MGKKTKDINRVGAKTYFGTSLMGLTDALAASLMTSWFLMYLTDYAGIGAWGAVLGGSLLLFARLFDAVNDPFQGWIMDKAKVGKHGKYKPFIIISILFEAIGLSGLFFLPEDITSSPVAVCIWVIVSYLIYDIGASFFAPNLIYRTLTLDSNQRGKMMIVPRMLSMIVGMLTASVISIVNSVNASFNNLHTAFGVTILCAAAGSVLISIIGISCIKEKYHSVREESSERVTLFDIFGLFKENKALRIRFIAQMFGGFIWTFLFATCMYYIKWAYATDLTTGVVNTQIYGTYALIGSMMMLIPLLIGTLIATPLMKAFKTPVRTYRFVMLLEAIPCGIMFLLQVLGILADSPTAFFVCLAVCATAIGIGYIPGESLNIECMDYEIYKNGKDRSALCNAANKFLDKAQGALSASLVASILVAVGYVVDSETDTYLGELSAIPSMLNWFIVIMGLIPFVLGIVSWFIYRYYPVTAEISADMKKKLSGMN